MIRFLALTVFVIGFITCARAQVISPGELSRAHTDLEGLSNCTSCHELGKVGITNTRCLDCHEPLRAQLAANAGFHNTIRDQNCGACHKDHFGLDFDVLRFDIESFDHDDTDYALLGAHTTVDCRTCHQPAFITAEVVRTFKSEHDALDRTWLGLSSTCETCHTSDNVHGDQFAPQDCNTCHTEANWEDTPGFDHDQTAFQLTGRHTDVACDQCHQPDQDDIVQFAGIAFNTCASCHGDVHQGQLGADCSTCHSTNDWDQFTDAFPIERFNHELTDFPLLGQHAEVSCEGCHQKPARSDAAIEITLASASLQSTFPDPAYDTCRSCHTDFHQGAFAESTGGAVCNNCHGEAGWTPSNYDLLRHNNESGFELTGSHLVVLCEDCHPATPSSGPVFHFEDQTCRSCHGAEDPHGAQFADVQGVSVCSTCHGTTRWDQLEGFSHDETDFSLTGVHASTSCESCHARLQTETGTSVQQFRGTETACAPCHAAEDPHAGQFAAQTCDTCHDTDSFYLDSFDHDQTRFVLGGAHNNLSCGSCHQSEETTAGEPFVRYKPLGVGCTDCHEQK